MLTTKELIEAILQYYDVDMLVEELDINATELLERFDDKLILNLDKFEHLNEEFESYDPREQDD